jgi:hypothetical protein
MEKINLEGDHVPWPDGADSFSQNMWDPSSQRNPHP